MHIANEYKHLVNHLIYPAPDPKYPFLGVFISQEWSKARGKLDPMQS